MQQNFKSFALITLAAAALLTGGMSGCKKEAPPPPPPVAPPPPPPPSTIKLDDLSQEMRVDARVQFSTDVAELQEDQADMGRAIIKLADAFAKGDAGATRALLTRRAQALLEELEQTGGWSEATAKIEAVRVVYIGPAPAMATMMDPTSMDEAMAAAQQRMAGIMPKIIALNTAMTEAIQAAPADSQAKLTAVMMEMASGDAMMPKPGQSAAEIMADARQMFDAFMQQFESNGVPAESVATLRTKIDELIASEAAAADPAAGAGDTGGGEGTGVLLAIQDPSGSYLLGWTVAKAFDKWVFTNAPSTSTARARASAWDGIGQAGFGEMLAAGPDLLDDKALLGSTPDSPTPPSGGESSTPNPAGPTRKNTPAGPITIPGG